MREAKIICPMTDNEGYSLVDAMCVVRGQLVESFGGVTIREAQGAWAGPNGVMSEDVWELTSAYVPSASNDATLAAIARGYCGRAGQFCVYVRFADGRVEFIDGATHEVAA